MTHDERMHQLLYSNEGRVEQCERICRLEELVRDMWRFTSTACKKHPRLFDPAAQGEQMVQLNMIDAFKQRMSELGVIE